MWVRRRKIKQGPGRWVVGYREVGNSFPRQTRIHLKYIWSFFICQGPLWIVTRKHLDTIWIAEGFPRQFCLLVILNSDWQIRRLFLVKSEFLNVIYLPRSSWKFKSYPLTESSWYVIFPFKPSVSSYYCHCGGSQYFFHGRCNFFVRFSFLGSITHNCFISLFPFVFLSTTRFKLFGWSNYFFYFI